MFIDCSISSRSLEMLCDLSSFTSYACLSTDCLSTGTVYHEQIHLRAVHVGTHAAAVTPLLFDHRVARHISLSDALESTGNLRTDRRRLVAIHLPS